MRPALITLAGGGNDIIGFRCDVPRLTQSFREVLESLTQTGATVVVFAGFDPRGRLPFGKLLAGRAAIYNASVVASASELGALVVDLWHLPGLYEHAMWAPDRLHLNAQGHVLVAAAVLRALGVSEAPEHVAADTEHDDVRRPWVTARRSDAEWVRTYFAPWVGRQLRGKSAGDLIDPKLPDLTVLPASRGESSSRC
jgi:hypothetical protein